MKSIINNQSLKKQKTMGIFEHHALVLKYIEEYHINSYPAWFIAKDGVVAQVTEEVALSYTTSDTVNVFKYVGRRLIALR